MSAILSHVGTSQVEWLKYWVLIPSYVVATIGVLIGVYLENDKFTDATEKLGWRILLWALAAEILFGSSIFAADGFVSSEQQAKIIELEIRTIPRHLDDKSVSELTAKLSKFRLDEGIGKWGDEGGQEIEVHLRPVTPESFHIGGQIGQVLYVAGFNGVAPALSSEGKMGGEYLGKDVPPVFGGIIVRAQATFERGTKTADFLARALTDAGLQGVQRVDSGKCAKLKASLAPQPLDSANNQCFEVEVIVGDRP